MNRIRVEDEVLETYLASVDNDLLDQMIELAMNDQNSNISHLTCWLIQAKQYRNLEMELL